MPGKPVASIYLARPEVCLLAQMRLLAIVAPLILTFPAGQARAQGIDLTQGGPIQITAKDGIEWRQAEQIVIAKGDARAVRGNVTVTADRLLAWYRRKGGDPASTAPASTAPASTAQATTASVQQGSNAPTPPSAAPTPPTATDVTGATDTEGNEVYRMRAEGNVHIFTATDQAWGDQATYDLDQAVLVMTGNALKLTTPNDILTARDTVEYWSQKHMAVARGDAVVVTNDARRISGDTLVAYTVPAMAGTAGAGTAGAGSTQSPVAVSGAAAQSQNGAQSANPGAANPGSAHPTGDPMAAMAGRLERVEAFNNVSARTPTDIVTGDRAVYIPDTGVAHLGGHVRITHGLNQINGAEAVVNMKTGVATLLSGDDGRVTGLVTPNDQSGPRPENGAEAKAPGARPKAAAPP
jgi:lipopolysaccharide export system protein LptA